MPAASLGSNEQYRPPRTRWVPHVRTSVRGPKKPGEAPPTLLVGPGYGCSLGAKPRDLQFYGPFGKMFSALQPEHTRISYLAKRATITDAALRKESRTRLTTPLYSTRNPRQRSGDICGPTESHRYAGSESPFFTPQRPPNSFYQQLPADSSPHTKSPATQHRNRISKFK